MCLWYIWIHLRIRTKAFTKQMLLCICMNSTGSWKQTGLCLVIPVELPLDTTSGNPLMEDVSISFICKHMFCFVQLFQLEIPVSGPRLSGKCPYPHVSTAFHWDNSISSEWFLWSYPPLWKHLPTYLHIDAATLWHSCF